mmetsp:Transcript_19161/g.24655  ORF Transcript_19161/g.24655 Transcript_19161/m.24655 type:complete len:157 (-) Transcript_19161:54-524(-)
MCGMATALKIMNEYRKTGVVSDPADKVIRRHLGVGSRSLDKEDIEYLLKLRHENPGRSLLDYQLNLEQNRGKKVCKDTICQLFLKSFPVCASMRKKNPVPVNEFQPENSEQLKEYSAATVNDIDPLKVEATEQKSPKRVGAYAKWVRPDPYTGELP